MVGGFLQRRLGNLDIQLDELLDAFQGLLGETEHGLDVGFLGDNDLFSGQHVNTSMAG